MPDHAFDRKVNAILRDDLLAQLRAAGRPMSTSQLRTNAPHQPLVSGGQRSYPPTQERIYRALCRLVDSGKVVRQRAAGRVVTWSAAPSDDDVEIEDLERAFNSPTTAGIGPSGCERGFRAHRHH
ncbi:hypothetical protein [Mycolicibacterium fortuitum]|uniref:hypothetical protein n=1 Tax=Mycolicibacterium fortuitum TaxID=1766 RepID=UPI0007EAF720|nr:hypothetical protein [Mycolicibacterium fortuitum]MDV7195555.1 hypothetical protein [Mycolicibacterium fortuitum]